MKLSETQRRELLDNLWSWIDPSIEGYSQIIADLLDTLTDTQLHKFVTARTGDELSND